MLQHMREAIEFVVNDLSFVNVVPVVEEIEVEETTVGSGIESGENVDVDDVEQPSKYVNCDVCNKRCERTGLHVHKRIHAQEAESVEEIALGRTEVVIQEAARTVEEICISSRREGV
jgi:hypothetical protein